MKKIVCFGLIFVAFIAFGKVFGALEPYVVDAREMMHDEPYRRIQVLLKEFDALQLKLDLLCEQAASATGPQPDLDRQIKACQRELETLVGAIERAGRKEFPETPQGNAAFQVARKVTFGLSADYYRIALAPIAVFGGALAFLYSQELVTEAHLLMSRDRWMDWQTALNRAVLNKRAEVIKAQVGLGAAATAIALASPRVRGAIAGGIRWGWQALHGGVRRVKGAIRRHPWITLALLYAGWRYWGGRYVMPYVEPLKVDWKSRESVRNALRKIQESANYPKKIENIISQMNDLSARIVEEISKKPGIVHSLTQDEQSYFIFAYYVEGQREGYVATIVESMIVEYNRLAAELFELRMRVMQGGEVSSSFEYIIVQAGRLFKGLKDEVERSRQTLISTKDSIKGKMGQLKRVASGEGHYKMD